ncbi:AraC family transcriptional regulator [Nocardia sp. NPDC051787]|uniref:cupin domain-containing protein n=1 Tax=Nocardia sp. NPDC051787 TaxID=3155415 RepID=UPI00342C98E0
MTAPIHRWLGGVVFTPGLMAFTGDIGDAAAHSHGAVQVLLVTRGELTLTDGSGAVGRADLAIIPPGVRHEVRATPGTAGFLAYLDPASTAGRAAVARLAGRPADRVDSWIAAAVPTPPGPPSRAPALPLPRRAAHPVVLAAMELADASPVGPPTLGEAARLVAMSPSRLSHLFSAEVGLPYAAWRSRSPHSMRNRATPAQSDSGSELEPLYSAAATKLWQFTRKRRTRPLLRTAMKVL